MNEIIGPKLIGMDVTKQTEIDKLMVETLALPAYLMKGTQGEFDGIFIRRYTSTI